ncbi:MAG: CRTAC1 family protein [Acidobacteriota bacterium]|jgi:hypothetical protein
MIALLAEIAAANPPGQAVQRRVEEMRAALDAGPLTPPERVQALTGLGIVELQVDAPRAIARLEEALALLPSLPAAARSAMQPTADFWAAVGYLREAMRVNCVERRQEAACVPGSGAVGVHEVQEPARKAIAHLEPVLATAPRNNPLYPAVRWLATIAYMAVGRWPDDVPTGFAAPAALIAGAGDFPRFNDVAAAAGINVLDTAGGVVVDDFDGDELLDVVTTTMDPAGQMRFFHNRGDGTFDDRTAAANLTGLVGGLNLNQADYDNDGDLDLLVLRGAWLEANGRVPNSLLRNNGDGTFTDVTFAAGLGEAHYPTQAAAWADYDNDGDLDLYIGNEHSPAQPAPSQLFRNNGDGTFADVAGSAFVANLARAKGVAWGDYDGDRLPDLWVANRGSDNRLYHNLGGGLFRDVALRVGVTGPRDAFASWFWDVDNDGALDLLVNNHGVPPDSAALPLASAAAAVMGDAQAAGHPALYRGNGRGDFTEVSTEYGLTLSTLAMGANFGDLDNDGWLDFLQGTGYPGVEGLLPDVMYRNSAGRGFEDITWVGGFGHLAKGHGVAFADVDNDGDQDVYQQLGGMLPNDEAWDALYENPGFGTHWITIRLVGTTSNRAAVGARIRLEIADGGTRRTIYRTIGADSSFGGNPLRAEIGLGAASTVDLLEIYWPTSDITQAFREVVADRFLRIVEGNDELEELRVGTFRLGGR